VGTKALNIPLSSPLQVIPVVDIVDDTLLLVNILTALPVHSLLSFTVIVYASASRPVNSFEVWKFVPSLEYSYIPEPPVAVTVIVPSLSPKHVGFVDDKLTLITSGFTIFTV
jgi:hypothetical protein